MPLLTEETLELVLEVKSFQGRITQCLTAVLPSGIYPSPGCTLVPLGPASCQHSRRGEASSFGQVTFLSQLWQAHPDASTGRGWDGFFEWTVLIYSVNLQYRAVTVHFSVSLMFFLSIQFWLLLPGKCCAGWVLLTWERSHCYNGSIKIAAISRVCPDYT